MGRRRARAGAHPLAGRSGGRVSARSRHDDLLPTLPPRRVPDTVEKLARARPLAAANTSCISTALTDGAVQRASDQSARAFVSL